MNDVTIIFIAALAFFAFVILALILERESMIRQNSKKEEKLLEENSRLVKAVIAKNANDYVMTTSIDKVAPEVKPLGNPDLVPEDSLSDEEFMAAINKTATAKT